MTLCGHFGGKCTRFRSLYSWHDSCSSCIYEWVPFILVHTSVRMVPGPVVGPLRFGKATWHSVFCSGYRAIYMMFPTLDLSSGYAGMRAWFKMADLAACPFLGCSVMQTKRDMEQRKNKKDTLTSRKASCCHTTAGRFFSLASHVLLYLPSNTCNFYHGVLPVLTITLWHK